MRIFLLVTGMQKYSATLGLLLMILQTIVFKLNVIFHINANIYSCYNKLQMNSLFIFAMYSIPFHAPTGCYFGHIIETKIMLLIVGCIMIANQ